MRTSSVHCGDVIVLFPTSRCDLPTGLSMQRTMRRTHDVPIEQRKGEYDYLLYLARVSLTTVVLQHTGKQARKEQEKATTYLAAD